MNTIKYMAVVLVVVTVFVPTLLVVMMMVRVRVDLPQPKLRYSSLAQTGIIDDLGLAVAEYSLFGSILTIGAMIGAIVSGKIADCIGRRGTMGFLEIFCLAGWLAIAFSKQSGVHRIFLIRHGRNSLGYNVRGRFTLSYLKHHLLLSNSGHEGLWLTEWSSFRLRYFP
ncbi:hypothetical protein CMV_011853 [Castanea mollissima]|uniref:Major facilitator superfamily (MFS) profile domain-containing protein n=1 Tax=Castanea mollissima TaxID=60419 RepID=A0A8J4R2H1_9ROSI|nr:hypothetical protein CMV_011853 [Castanea mollissima]